MSEARERKKEREPHQVKGSSQGLCSLRCLWQLMPSKPQEIIIAQRAVGMSLVRRERDSEKKIAFHFLVRWIVGILGISIIKVRWVLVC